MGKILRPAKGYTWVTAAPGSNIAHLAHLMPDGSLPEKAMCNSKSSLGLAVAVGGKRPCGNCMSRFPDLMVEEQEPHSPPEQPEEDLADLLLPPFARAKWHFTVDDSSGWAGVKATAAEKEVFESAKTHLKTSAGAWYDDRCKWWVMPAWVALRMIEALQQDHVLCEVGSGKVSEPETGQPGAAELRRLYAIIAELRTDNKALQQECERLDGQCMDLSKRLDALEAESTKPLALDEVRAEALDAARDFWNYRVNLNVRAAAQRDTAKRVADAGFQGAEAKAAVEAAMAVRYPEPVKAPEGLRVIDFDDLFK